MVTQWGGRSERNSNARLTSTKLSFRFMLFFSIGGVRGYIGSSLLVFQRVADKGPRQAEGRCHAVLRKVVFKTVVFLAVGFKDVVFSQFLNSHVKKGDRDFFFLAVFKRLCSR